MGASVDMKTHTLTVHSVYFTFAVCYRTILSWSVDYFSCLQYTRPWSPVTVTGKTTTTWFSADPTTWPYSNPFAWPYDQVHPRFTDRWSWWQCVPSKRLSPIFPWRRFVSQKNRSCTPVKASQLVKLSFFRFREALDRKGHSHCFCCLEKKKKTPWP